LPELVGLLEAVQDDHGEQSRHSRRSVVPHEKVGREAVYRGGEGTFIHGWVVEAL
jgi:hypothetical protein